MTSSSNQNFAQVFNCVFLEWNVLAFSCVCFIDSDKFSSFYRENIIQIIFLLFIFVIS